MVSFFIGPYEPTTWEIASSDLKIDPEWYQKRLIERWPIVSIIKPSTENYLLEWIMPETMEGAGIICGLHKDYQIISMDTPFEDLILWHRSVIPSRYELYLFREGAWESLELNNDTTIDDLEKFIGRRV